MWTYAATAGVVVVVVVVVVVDVVVVVVVVGGAGGGEFEPESEPESEPDRRSLPGFGLAIDRFLRDSTTSPFNIKSSEQEPKSPHGDNEQGKKYSQSLPAYSCTPSSLELHSQV
jgi:hypothetical protein